MLFQDWSGVGRVLLVGSMAYAFLVITLRVSGKRTLAKMNAFDLVVTVALGSTLATILLTSTVSLAEGSAGIALLVVLQYTLARFAVRLTAFQGAIRSQPTLLVERGRVEEEALRRERVTHAELRQALRSQGIGSLENVAAVVIETDGTLSVVAVDKLGPTGSALVDVAGWGARR